MADWVKKVRCQDLPPPNPLFFLSSYSRKTFQHSEFRGSPSHGYTVIPEETEAVGQELGGCMGHQLLVLPVLPVPSKGSLEAQCPGGNTLC